MSENALRLFLLLGRTEGDIRADIQRVSRKTIGRKLSFEEVELIRQHIELLLQDQAWLDALIKQAIEEKKPRFESWMKAVDKAIWDMAACHAFELPDFDFWSLFAVGSTPEQAADAILSSVGFTRFE